MTAEHPWFAVDKNGLAKLLEKRGKAFALFELLQNAWDTGRSSTCTRGSFWPS